MYIFIETIIYIYYTHKILLLFIAHLETIECVVVQNLYLCMNCVIKRNI